MNPPLDDILIKIELQDAQIAKLSEIIDWILLHGIAEAKRRVDTEIKAMNTFTFKDHG